MYQKKCPQLFIIFSQVYISTYFMLTEFEKKKKKEHPIW